ncbi:MAG: LacI family DNA-binding transcriptional regulator [bacterium]|nr:LacI family DNA-binding transcriptional regulator [bacterium]
MAKKRATTIHDVARRAGVAPITVSRVINNSSYISAETRARVEAAIEELHYVPNGLSRSLRSKKTNTIALLVSDITNPFWPAVTRGVEDASSERAVNVVLCNTDENPEKLENYVNVLLQRQMDGFLLVPIQGDAEVRTIQRQQVPIVVVDRLLPEVDVVRSDSESGAYELTRYLLELGHREIAMLCGPFEIITTQQRLAGFRRAMQEAGFVPNENLIFFGQYRPEGGYAMTMDVLKSARPTALFAVNNFIAAGVLSALDELGLRVPEDISLVAFDDLPIFPRSFLTVAAQRPYELGWRAASLLLDIIDGSTKPATRDTVLPVDLLVRDSCLPIVPAEGKLTT